MAALAKIETLYTLTQGAQALPVNLAYFLVGFVRIGWSRTQIYLPGIGTGLTRVFKYEGTAGVFVHRPSLVGFPRVRAYLFAVSLAVGAAHRTQRSCVYLTDGTMLHTCRFISIHHLIDKHVSIHIHCYIYVLHR